MSKRRRRMIVKIIAGIWAGCYGVIHYVVVANASLNATPHSVVVRLQNGEVVDVAACHVMQIGSCTAIGQEL